VAFKFQRDSTEKAKAKTGEVSNSAVKAFLAKRKQSEEQRKAVEESERRKRIMARLDGEQGKRKSSKDNGIAPSNETQRGAKAEPNTLKVSPRNSTAKTATIARTSNPIKGTKAKSEFQIPKKKAIERDEAARIERNSSANGSNLKLGSSGESGSFSFKQRRRRKGKESDFEWSGSSSTQNNDIIRSKSQLVTKSFYKKSASAPSFQELMNIAKQQKDKPVPFNEKAAVEESSKSSKSEIPLEKSSKFTTGIGKSANQELRRQSEFISKKSQGVEHGKKILARDDIRAQISKQNRCTVTTHTAAVKSNYDPGSSAVCSPFKNGSGSRIGNFRSGLKVNGQRTGSVAGSKRPKVSSIDDELELEKRQLERKRNLLQMKLQSGKRGHGYYNEYEDADNYYDELDDFIDDGGDEFDYSKHIRSIFGYDRRQYADEDDDLRDMESNYRQIAVEEARSARIGKLEDEIERRKEEMEKRKEKKIKR